MKEEALWRIAQQRHLIVRRRGIIDTRYLARTADHFPEGKRIEFNATYVEASMALVRDVGLAFVRLALTNAMWGSRL